MIRRFLITALAPGSIVFFCGCSESSLQITDEFVEVNKPGRAFGIVEVKALSIDTIFGYPNEVIDIRSMTLIDRKTERMIGEGAYAKVFFTKRHSKYIWRIKNDIVIADYILRDTISLQPNTWYRVSKEKGTYGTKYFYWEGIRKEFKTFVVPNHGAW